MYPLRSLSVRMSSYGGSIFSPFLLRYQRTFHYSSTNFSRHRRQFQLPLPPSLYRITFSYDPTVKYLSTVPSPSSNDSGTTVIPSSTATIIHTISPNVSSSLSTTEPPNENDRQNNRRRQRYWYYGLPIFTIGSVILILPFGYWLYHTSFALRIHEQYLFNTLPLDYMELETIVNADKLKYSKNHLPTVGTALRTLPSLAFLMVANTYNYGLIDTVTRWAVGMSLSQEGRELLGSLLCIDSVCILDQLYSSTMYKKNDTVSTTLFYTIYYFILRAWLRMDDDRNSGKDADNVSLHYNLFEPILALWPTVLHRLLLRIPSDTANPWIRRVYDTLTLLIETEIGYQQQRQQYPTVSPITSLNTLPLGLPNSSSSGLTTQVTSSSIVSEIYTVVRRYMYSYIFRDQLFPLVYELVNIIPEEGSSLLRNIGWLRLTALLGEGFSYFTMHQRQQLQRALSSSVIYLTLQHLTYADSMNIPSCTVYDTTYTDFLIFMNTLCTLQTVQNDNLSSVDINIPVWYNQAFQLWNCVYLLLDNPSTRVDNVSFLRLLSRIRLLSRYIVSFDPLKKTSGSHDLPSIKVPTTYLYGYFIRIHALLLHLTCRQPKYIYSLVFGRNLSSSLTTDTSLSFLLPSKPLSVPPTDEQETLYRIQTINLLYESQRIMDYLFQNDASAYELILRTVLHRPALEPLVHVSLHDMIFSLGYDVYNAYTQSCDIENNGEKDLSANKEWSLFKDRLERGQDIIDGVFLGKIQKFRQRMITPFRNSSNQTFPEKVTSTTNKWFGSIYGKTQSSFSYLQSKLGFPNPQNESIWKDWDVNIPFASNSVVYTKGETPNSPVEEVTTNQPRIEEIEKQTSIPSNSSTPSVEHPLSQHLFIMDDDLGIGLGTGIRISMVPDADEFGKSNYHDNDTNFVSDTDQHKDNPGVSSFTSLESKHTVNIEIEPSSAVTGQTRGAMQRNLVALYCQVLLTEGSVLVQNNVDNICIPVYSSTAGSLQIINDQYDAYRLYEMESASSKGTIGVNNRKRTMTILHGPSLLDLLLCYVRSSSITDNTVDKQLLHLSSNILRSCLVPSHSSKYSTSPSDSQQKHRKETYNDSNDDTLDQLRFYRTTIAKAWLQSIFYSLVYATKSTSTDFPFLSNDIRISAVREYGRWINREIVRIPTNLANQQRNATMNPKGEDIYQYSYSPWYIYQLANYHAQSLSLKGILPPLISDLYNPLAVNYFLQPNTKTVKSASFSPQDSPQQSHEPENVRTYSTVPSFGATLPSIDIHLYKALSYLVSGNTPDDLSLGKVSPESSSSISLQRLTTQYLYDHQAFIPMYTLLKDTITQMNNRYEELHRLHGSKNSSLSILLQDRIYRDYCTSLRQLVRLWGNFGYAITPSEKETIGRIIGNDKLLTKYFSSLLDHHDSKLRGHAWRGIHNWSIGTSDDTNVRYGDLLYPLYDNSRPSEPVRSSPNNNDDNNNNGIDIVFVHGLQGLSLKTWRTNTFIPSIDTYTNDHLGKDGTGTSSNSVLQYTKASVYRDNKVLPIWPVLWLAKDLEIYIQSLLSYSSSSVPSKSSSVPNIRMIALAYDADVWGGPYTTIRPHIRIEDTAAEASRELVKAGIGQNNRKVVFIGHSMGGLLIKWLLLHAAKHPSSALSTLPANTSSVIFLGVPHHGAPLATFAVQNLGHYSLPKKLFTPSGHVETLGETLILENLNKSFEQLLHQYPDMRILSCAEGLPTLIPGLSSSLVSSLLSSQQKVASLLYTAKEMKEKANVDNDPEEIGEKNNDPSFVSSYTHIQVVPISSADPGYHTVGRSSSFIVLDKEDHISISKPTSTKTKVYQLILQNCQEVLAGMRNI